MCCLFVFSFVIGLHYSHSQNFVLLFISMSQTITWSQKSHFPSIRIKIISSIPHCLGTITFFKEHDQVLSSYIAQCYSCYSALHLVGFSSVTFNKEQKDLQLDYHWNSHIRAYFPTNLLHLSGSYYWFLTQEQNCLPWRQLMVHRELKHSGSTSQPVAVLSPPSKTNRNLTKHPLGHNVNCSSIPQGL